MTASHHSLRHVTAGLLRGTGWTVSTVVMTVVIAAGIPLMWVFIASKLAGTNDDVTPSLALFITAGILVNYWLALLIGARVRSRFVDSREEVARRRRMSWNRSFRDEPVSVGRDSDPIERLFIFIAVVAVIAFEIWFFFFAGSPLPSQPLF
jgi:hypothetical protein